MPPIRFVRSAACFFLSFVVLSYAGLIALGRWQLDEYAEFYRMRDLNFRLYLSQRLSWSPRPISETLYCSYGWLVNYFHRPLIGPFLTVLWAIFFLAGLLTFWIKRRQASAEDSWNGLIVALTLLGLSLAGGHTTEVFYWPAGAVAYLPTLGATLLIFLQVIEGQLDLPQGRFIVSTCLVIAAGSSEAGAAFALCYTLIQILQRVRELVEGDRSWSKPFLWYMIPFFIAVPVLIAAQMHRFRVPEGDSVSAVVGHPIASIIASLKELLFEGIGRNILVQTFHANPHPSQWLRSGWRLPLELLAGSRLAMEILLVAGVALIWTLRRPGRKLVRQTLEMVAALLLASCVTLVAANMHFGFSCCERHELLRESWMTMMLTGGTIACTGWITEHRRLWLQRRRSWAPCLLVLAVVSLGFFRPLVHTYRLYPWLKRVNDQNFSSGFQQNTGEMRFSVLPYEGIIVQEGIPTGTFKRRASVAGFSYDVYPDYLLSFFDKQTVVIRSLDASAAGSRMNEPLH